MVAASLGMRLAAQCTCPLTFDASPLAYIGLDTTFVVGWDGRSTWILRERKTEIWHCTWIQFILSTMFFD